MIWPLPHAPFITFCLLFALAMIELVLILTAARFRHSEVRASAGLVFGQAYLSLLKLLLFVGLGVSAFRNPIFAGANGIAIASLAVLALAVGIWCELGPLRRLRGMLALLTPHDDLSEGNLSKLKYIKSRRLHGFLLVLSGILLTTACVLAVREVLEILPLVAE